MNTKRRSGHNRNKKNQYSPPSPFPHVQDARVVRLPFRLAAASAPHRVGPSPRASTVWVYKSCHGFSSSKNASWRGIMMEWMIPMSGQRTVGRGIGPAHSLSGYRASGIGMSGVGPAHSPCGGSEGLVVVSSYMAGVQACSCDELDRVAQQQRRRSKSPVTNPRKHSHQRRVRHTHVYFTPCGNKVYMHSRLAFRLFPGVLHSYTTTVHYQFPDLTL